MFGYFLRRVDQRFQLERVLGTLTPSREDAVARLERLFQDAEANEQAMEDTEMGSNTNSTSGSGSSSSSTGASSGEVSSSDSASSSSMPARKEKSALRRYVEGFDQAVGANRWRNLISQHL